MNSILHARLVAEKSLENKRKSWNLTITSSKLIGFKLPFIVHHFSAIKQKKTQIENKHQTEKANIHRINLFHPIDEKNKIKQYQTKAQIDVFADPKMIKTKSRESNLFNDQNQRKEKHK